MTNLELGLLILAGFLVVQSFFILGVLRQAANQRIKTIQQLLIATVGKGEKPESTLRALVASDRPPKKNLPGIAKTEKKDNKNVDYKMSIGVK